MLSTDLVAELRAEVTRWWHQLQRQQQQKLKDLAQQPSASSSKSASVFFNTPILGAMLGDTPLRMIASGQELTPDCDERTLAEMQIKDHQVRTACLCDDPCSCACLAIYSSVRVDCVRSTRFVAPPQSQAARANGDGDSCVQRVAASRTHSECAAHLRPALHRRLQPAQAAQRVQAERERLARLTSERRVFSVCEHVA